MAPSSGFPRASRLTRQPGVALYAVVREAIESEIAKRQLQPGDPLPTEGDLRSEFGVSRATIRQALAELERRGVIERRQGRGTFITRPPLQLSLPELTGFSDHVRARGMRPSSRVVEFRELAPHETPPEAHLFAAGMPLVRLFRTRVADGEPIAIHDALIPRVVTTRLGLNDAMVDDPDFSLYRQFAAAGIDLAWAEERLRARRADRTEASLLGVPAGSAVMDVLRLSHDASDELVEVVRAVLVGDRYDYVVHLQRGSPSEAPGGVIRSGGERQPDLEAALT